MSDRDIKTYILLCESDEYYCGKTIDLNKRMKEHREGKNGSWFLNDKRRNFQVVLQINGDFEKNIKSFGVAKFVNCLSLIEKGCPLS